MSKRVIVAVVLILSAAALLIFLKSPTKGGRALISPQNPSNWEVRKAANPIPSPTTPAYNPPKEVKYDSSTNLKKELDSINPQVLDSDFKDL